LKVRRRCRWPSPLTSEASALTARG